jgi:hypothetical protein
MCELHTLKPSVAFVMTLAAIRTRVAAATP